ncbi:MAG: T9SS type A sorting domain-containing protein [Bacteroidia bacterium]|nr:T9SS type A sorting domain-containing protein [Bacteroidia bacterium]
MKKIICLFVLALATNSLLAQSYAVGHIQITYNDPARQNRAIQTEIYYPAAVAGESVPVASGTFPVIAYGHGFVMVWSAYQNIWEALVPAGYIVAFPRTEGNVSPVHAEFGADLAFLIAKIQSEGAQNTSSLFYNHVGSTSAVMGHSMGGGSSFLAAENNNSITTMVTMAAANTNPSSIAAASNITIPSLVIAGQNDCVAPPAQHQLPMYDSLNSSCKAYVEILGGGHCYFAENNFNCSFGEGTCTPNPTISRAEQQDASQDFALMWLNFYLKNDCAAWTAFQDSMVSSARVNAQMSCAIVSPVITSSGNQLNSTAAATYQWLLNGSPVAGATSQNYTPTQNGLYEVVVTYNGSPCPDTSNQINWVMTGLQEIAPEFLQVFPVPADQQLNFVSSTSGDFEIVITDMAGRSVFSTVQFLEAGQNASLNTSVLTEGMYQLQIFSETNGSRSQKLFSVMHR